MDAFSPTLALERFELQRRVWRFGTAGGETHAPQIRLLPGGRIGACGHPNEHRWDVRGETLVFLDRAGRATNVFDEHRFEDGRVVFEGRFVAEPGVRRVLAETDPVDPPVAPEARIALRPRDRLQPRRNLVVLRADASSLHRRWARDLGPGDRSWDLCLLWRGSDEGEHDDPDADYHAIHPDGGDWETFGRLVHPGSPLARYDFVMFVDSEVLWSWSGVNAAFALARDQDLALAHPAMGDTAGGIDELARPRPDALLHFARPLPLVAPIFSAEALRLCGPSFLLAPDGHGAGELWPALLGVAENRIAVLDATLITRPRLRRAPAPTRETEDAAASLLKRFGVRAARYDGGTLALPPGAP